LAQSSVTMFVFAPLSSSQRFFEIEFVIEENSVYSNWLDFTNYGSRSSTSSSLFILILPLGS